MSSFSVWFRRHARWSVALPGLLLLFGLFVGGAHFHERSPDHSCAVCTMSHAPAATSVVSTPAAISGTSSERVELPSFAARAASIAREHFGRAPPQS